MTTIQNRCLHKAVVCLNEYDLIRKYRCEDCRAVMMCTCDEEIGKAFLPHQLKMGAEYGTRTRITVTHGFQPRICRECRGLPPEPHPRAERYGQTSKINRYYWREIWRLKHTLFLQWARDHDYSPVTTKSPDAQAAWVEAEEQALAEIKMLHEKNPKYSYSEESEEAVIKNCNVEVVALQVTYARKSGTKRVQVLDGSDRVSVEEYVTRHYARDGWQSVPLESRPFHALFGVLMWLLIQDPSDEQSQIVGTGDRRDFDAKRRGQPIFFPQPKDFGSAAYGIRRADNIAAHLSKDMLDRDKLLWLFDYWVEPSWTLRNYLWAHKDEDVRAARRLVEIISPSTIIEILRYLVEDYWHHYLGWPDLLVWKDGEYFLVEVKSTNDKLSEDQKRWVRDNFERLHLPFRLVKLCKSQVID